MDIFNYYKSFLESTGAVTQYKYTDQMREEIGNLLKYFSKKADSNLDKERGIVLMGDVGQGKTLFFNTVKKIIDDKYKESFLLSSAIDIIKQFNECGESGIRFFENSKNLVIDDYGTEALEGKNFGKTYTIGDLIELRYEKWLTKKHLTHITTNLTKEQMKERLGARAFDRIMQMSQPVSFTFMPYSFREMPESKPNFIAKDKDVDVPNIDKDKIMRDYLNELETRWKPRVLDDTFRPFHNSFGEVFYDALVELKGEKELESSYEKNKKGIIIFKEMCRNNEDFTKLKI